MKILTKYLIKEYLSIIFVLQLVFVVIYLVVDLFRIDRFLEYGATGFMIVEYYVYKIPLILFQTVPVAVLIGALILTGQMAKQNEITILRAGGISLFRVVVPMLSVAALISLSIFVFNEFLVAAANKQVAYVEQVKIKKKAPKSLFSNNWIWFRNKEGLFYNIKAISSNKDLSGVSILSFDQNFHLQKRVDAEHMTWEQGKWRLTKAVMREFSSTGVKYQSEPVLFYDRIKDKPEDFNQVKIKPEVMSYRELKQYVKSLKTKGFKTTKYEVEIQAKFAHSLISLIMVLLAIPFALSSRRSDGQALSFTMGIIAGFGYWMFLAAGYALGRGGALSPVVSSWMGNLLFGSFGMYRLMKINQ